MNVEAPKEGAIFICNKYIIRGDERLCQIAKTIQANFHL